MKLNIKLYIMDVDGTLGKPASGGDFRKTAADWEFYPGRQEYCRGLVASGATIILATNQGGVCFPWSRFTEAEIKAVLDKTAQDVDALASLVSCSSTNPKALPEYLYDDPRRKPKPGMLLEAMELAKALPEETIMIGDRKEDEEAAKAAGVSFELAEIFFADVP